MSDKALPRVTEILKAVGMIDDAWFTQYDLERGTAVHEACALLARGDLDWSTVDDAIKGRVEAWRRFLAHISPVVVEIEGEVRHDSYVGHFDYLVRIGSESVFYLLDLKGPSEADWHGTQLAAYALPMRTIRPQRANVHLHDDASYRVVMHTDDRDFAIWRDALRRFKEMQT